MLALIAWSAAGGAAWIELRRDRPEDPRIEEARREAALLRDRLEVVSADTVALADATERGFQGLATALEQRAANGDADVRALASRLASLETELARLSHAEAERAERLAAALRELPSGARAALEPLPVEEPIATTPVFEIEPQAAPPQPAASRSFLAFKLPAHEQGFEGRRTYDVLGELSRVGFDAKSTLHDFTGTSGSVRGSLQVDLSRPADGISGTVEVEARSLSTSNEARDEAMLEHLDVERHPRITFTPSAFEVEAVDVAQRTVEGTVRGRMVVRGVEREVEMRVNGHLDEARRLVVEGEMSLALPDYGVEVPSKLGLISMQETVRVWVHLRARARLGESRR